MLKDLGSLPAFPSGTAAAPPLPADARKQHSRLPSGLRRRVSCRFARGRRDRDDLDVVGLSRSDPKVLVGGPALVALDEVQREPDCS